MPRAPGSAGRTYPWGDEKPDPERCNFGRNVGGTTPAGSYPEGATPEGVRDLSGNVWERVPGMTDAAGQRGTPVPVSPSQPIT